MQNATYTTPGLSWFAVNLIQIDCKPLYGHQADIWHCQMQLEVWVRGYVDRVVIGCGGDVIAHHPRCRARCWARCWDRDDMIFDPVHYLPLLAKKLGALE